MSESKSIKKNALYSGLKAFLNIATPLITFPYASRILLPEGIGRVNFANTVITYFILFAKLGIDNYATREAAKIKDDKEKLAKFVKEILTINTISTIISFVLFFISLFIINEFAEDSRLLLICSVRMAVMLIELPWLFNAKEEFKSVTIRTAIFQFLSLIFLFIFVRGPEDIHWYCLYGVLTISGTAISNFFISRKLVDYKIKVKLEIKKHFKYIITFWGMSFITSFYNMLDTLMLRFLSTNTEIGYYSSAIKVNNLIIELITAISIVILPRLSSYKEENKTEDFSLLVKKSFNLLILIAIPLCFGIFLLSQHIIIILTGKAFLPAVTPMKILTPLIFFISLSNLIGNQIFPAINKERTSLLIYFIAIIINISLNFFFIPRYNATGASISTIIAESFVTIVLLIICRNMFFDLSTLKNFIQIFFASVIMGAAVFLAMKISHVFIIQILLGIFAGIFVYATILFLIKNIYFIELIKNLRHKNIS